MSERTKHTGWRSSRRWVLLGLAALAMASLIGTVIIGVVVDRAQCRGAAQAIDNSRTMWLYAIEQNPGPEADKFRAELDRRIPPAHCRGGTLIVDEAITVPSTPPVTHSEP